MDVKLQISKAIHPATLAVSGSKSETNRLLLLKALYPGIVINNASESDDSEVMRKALAGNSNIIDVYHAGTAMRFLTAYYAIQEGREVVITGSARMKERPIGVLVDALRSIGAAIEYVENEGYPPIKIKGKKITAGGVAINAGVSSQYITALLLVAARLKNGLEVSLEGEITSRPYLEMTVSLLQQAGIDILFSNNTVKVSPRPDIQNLIPITVESDWSSASYFYSIVALSPVGTWITLSSYKKGSLQGDSALAEIYSPLGVETKFDDNTITLHKTAIEPQPLHLSLINTPDIAQTIAVTCFGLGTGCHLTGLHTLKIKETDRLEAMKTELQKFGADISVTNDSIIVKPGTAVLQAMQDVVEVDTYNDHRMAMAFAPLAVKIPLVIKDAGVVSKSYPAFWEDIAALGITVSRL